MYNSSKRDSSSARSLEWCSIGYGTWRGFSSNSDWEGMFVLIDVTDAGGWSENPDQSSRPKVSEI
jgi:hypothetical protein